MLQVLIIKNKPSNTKEIPPEKQITVVIKKQPLAMHRKVPINTNNQISD